MAARSAVLVILLVGALNAEEAKQAFQTIEINGQLADTDPPDRKLNHPCKLHRVDFAAGKTYIIDLIARNNGQFDPFLRLEDPRGVQLAEDDDAGGNLNSRIQYTAVAAGNYQLSVTTLNGNVGAYLLRVRQIEEVRFKLPAAVDLGAGGFVAESKLDVGDAKSPVRRALPCKVYSFNMKAGRTYVIDLQSGAFDAYLHVLAGNLKSVAEDDDSGGNLNARIAFRPPADGTYHVVATSLSGGEGAFTLRIRADK